MTIRMAGVVVVTGLLLCHASAQAPAVSAAGARDLLRASAPGAYSVRYLPDRALISADTRADTELRVHIPRPPLWGYVGTERKPASFFAWDEDSALVTVQLEGGRHELQVGWEGRGELPQQGQEIPVLADGRRIATLTARFTLDGMSAEGAVEHPPARARLWLTPVEGVDEVDAVLTVAGARADTWRPSRGRLMARGHVIIGGDGMMRLAVSGYNLLRSPVQAVEIEELGRAAKAVPVDDMPDDGIIIEAEDYVREGGGTVMISEGDHHDQHGGKSVYSFTGDGHWLEWEFEAPQDGMYDLFARVATAEEMSFREVMVNRRLPAPGFGMVRFPGTGGWARGPGEWQAVQIAGGSDDLPPLSLRKGRNTLRLKGILPQHLNVDYFVLRKRP